MKYYLTTPIYYVNSKPHIGHAYTSIAADTLARFKRLTGTQVLFLTGTDEHGQKIDKAAKEAGVSPIEFTNRIAGLFKDAWKALEIEPDDFIRTTEPRHIQTVQAIWRELAKRDEIYKDVYSGWYCTPCETFFTDRQVLTENNQTICPDCKRPVEKIEEENYFLKMSKYQAWLKDHILKNPDFIQPEIRRNEVLGFLDNNTLQDLCISRPKSRLAWGIVSPLSEAHVTYVWLDALVNYISACGYGRDEKLFKKWWPCDVHLVGKDILRHHAVYWPIILHAAGIELPKTIFAHGWWVQGGEKMSKSRGNVIDPLEISKTYGVDAFRYFILRDVPFGFDGTFSEEALVERFNHDLANDLGNLLHRTLTMCEKYFGGEVPQKVSMSCQSTLRASVNNLPPQMTAFMDRLSFSESLEAVWKLINEANKFIETSAPWKLSKEGKNDELKACIASLIEVLRIIAQGVWPFMPKTGEAVWQQLGIEEPMAKVPFVKDSWGYFENRKVMVKKGAPLFPRIEKEATK